MSNRCSCCGASLELGAARCKYCGAAAPVVAQNDAPQGNANQNQNTNQAPNQTLDALQAWLMNNALAVEAARNAAEAARNAAEAARSAAEAVANYAPTHNGSSSVAASSSNGKDCGDNLFACPNWEELWRAKGQTNKELGIILTNTKGLKNADVFMAALNSYLDYKSQNGIDYCVLDLNDQAVCEIDPKNIDQVVLGVLDQVYDVVVPHYLLILGDSTVVPCANWENVCDDGDETVPSDLAYTQLYVDSPWDGVQFFFGNITQVGRIPAKASNGFSEAIAYFEYAKRFAGYSGTKSFAYSAHVWEPTSRAEFSHLNPNLVTSPKYTSNSREAGSNGLRLLDKLSSDYNMVCFNLHGSDESHVWYGQIGYDYPEAFDKKLLPQNGGYALMTEACYGARPTSSDSIVVNALTKGCVGFVGSTRIAYGMGNGQLACADIIAQTFTASVAKGATFGRAFLDALAAQAAKEMDETEVKTLAEFALYGDPSIRLITSGAHSTKMGKKGGVTAVKYSKPKKDQSRAITLACCESGSGRSGKSTRIMPLSLCSAKEQAQMKAMTSYVSKAGNQYIMQKFSSMSDVKPSVYKVVGKDEYRAVYSKKQGNVKTVVKMHMDGKGNVKKVYHSK